VTTETEIDMDGLVELAPGYRTRVVDEGRGDAVVLLHGTPFDLRAWDPLVTAVAGRRRTARFDARGHGAASDVGVPDFGRLAEDAVAVMDRLGLPSAHVVGHSWGGQTAQRLALDHPDRVSRLSLLCTRASPFPAFASVAQGLRDGTADVEASLTRWFTPAELAEPTAAAVTVREQLHAADPLRWADALEEIATFDVLAELPRITVPTDVVAAEHDGVAAPEHMAGIAAALPRASHHVLAGARHLAPLQRADEIAAILLDAS
jgi:3-oxoadipate enol-lactonase